MAQPLDPPEPPAGSPSEVEPAEDDAIQGEVVDETTAAARRAADFVLARRYGPATKGLVAHIAHRAIDTSDLNAVILEQMAIQLAQAETGEDILDPFGTVKGKALLGVPLWVIGTEFLESDMAEGFPWYVSFRVLDRQTNRTSVVTVGGEKLVLQAAEFDRKGLWPYGVRIMEAEKETKAGFRPLELRKAN